MWHNARAQLSQRMVGGPGSGVFFKSVFNTCQLKSARRVSNVGKAVLPQNLATRPDKCVPSPNFGQGTDLILL
jgi:hypothetical protein